MKLRTSFGGVSGQALQSLVSPGLLFTLIPVGILYVIALALGSVAIKSPLLFGIIFMWANAELLGAFAIPASRGDFEHTITSSQLERGDCTVFAFRFLAITTVVTVVSGGLLYLLDTPPLFALFNLMAPGLGFRGAIVFLVTLAAIVLPLMAAIVSLMAQSFLDIFKPKLWLWLLLERRGDLSQYFALLIGTTILLFFLYLPPLLILGGFLQATSADWVIRILASLTVLPMIAIPVVIGRFSGAFVFDIAEAGASQSAAKAEPETPTPVLPAKTAPLHSTVPVYSAVEDEKLAQILPALKQAVSATEGVQDAYVYRLSVGSAEAQMTCAVTIDSSVKLGQRHQVVKGLQEKLRTGLADTPCAVALMTDTNRDQILEAGLRFFSRNK